MRSRRPAYLMPTLAILAVLSAGMPLVFWHDVWFGRGLSDPDLERYLNDQERPRRIQHALSQISERVARGESMGQHYPRIAELARHSSPEVRTTAAWVMGQDNRLELFRRTLLSLLQDSHPMVRRNAALSLVRFADAHGRKELVGMLHSDLVPAPVRGQVRMQLETGQEVGSGHLMARIRTQQGADVEVRSPYPGEVLQVLALDRSSVAAGEPVARIRPSRDQVWEALRGLSLVGQPEDLPEVEEYARAAPGVPAPLRRQAALTARAIRNRYELDPTH